MPGTVGMASVGGTAGGAASSRATASPLGGKGRSGRMAEGGSPGRGGRQRSVSAFGDPSAGADDSAGIGPVLPRAGVGGTAVGRARNRAGRRAGLLAAWVPIRTERRGPGLVGPECGAAAAGLARQRAVLPVCRQAPRRAANPPPHPTSRPAPHPPMRHRAAHPTNRSAPHPTWCSKRRCAARPPHPPTRPGPRCSKCRRLRRTPRAGLRRTRRGLEVPSRGAPRTAATRRVSPAHPSHDCRGPDVSSRGARPPGSTCRPAARLLPERPAPPRRRRRGGLAGASNR